MSIEETIARAVEKRGSDKMETLKILFWLSEGYPNEKISQQTLLVYGEALADCNEEDLKQAALNLLRVKNNFPTVAEIVQEVEEIRASSLLKEALYEYRRDYHKNG